MTAYILHGGNAQNQNTVNDKFFGEILAKTSSNPRILLVHFAAVPEKKETYRMRDISQFERVGGEKKIEFDEAEEGKFIDQIKNADVIYFCGGTTVRLMQVMKRFDIGELKKAFIGKVVVGESAGANSLAAYSYSKSGGGVIPGLGMVPVKMLPHYDQELEQAKSELENVYVDLPMVVLPEFKFRVIEG